MSLIPEDFLFARYLSLAPLVDSWRTESETASEPGASLARQLVEEVDGLPDLLVSTPDLAAFDDHRGLVDALMGALFPSGLRGGAIGAAIAPFEPAVFYQTSAFRSLRLLDQFAVHLQTHSPEVWDLGRTMSAYHFILSRCYGHELDLALAHRMVLPVRDEQRGVERHFRLTFDPQFCRVEVRGELPVLSEEDRAELLANRMDLERWKRALPPDRFEFHGFTVVQAVDVTDQQMLSLFERDLLERDALTSGDSLDRLEGHLRALFRNPQLRMGIVSMEYGDFDVASGLLAVGRSLLLSGGQAPECRAAGQSLYAQATRSRLPVVAHDLETHEQKTGYEFHLQELGIRNVLIAPLHDGDRLVGLLELASPNPGDLHEFNTKALLEITGLLATALQRSLEEREDRVQAVIKEQYTAIHPVVEWKFRESAQRFLQHREGVREGDGGEEKTTMPQLAPIVFRDVYPLYGLTDIRGSSVQRNTAIQDDLVEQLGIALQVIVEASTEKWLPALDEIGYRIANHAQDIADRGLQSGDELRVLDFLQREVEPLLDQVAAFGPATRSRVAAYREALDPELGVLYRRRRAFEESVALVNETVSRFIDAREEEAQAIVPHYFEKFQTDGVDYNIYAGASLVRNGDFTALHLRSLRLWQLMMMCGIVWELARREPDLKLPLRTTHLILVHSNPLSIRFRHDEKQFDVDGAYNIRYEIVKKRIDKAVIRGTEERLTQPGQIAIVYEHERDAAEYRRYIEYMQAANYLADEVEDLRLEDMQGVFGLRALRVTVRERAEDQGATLLANGRIEEISRHAVAGSATPKRGEMVRANG